MIKQSVNNQCAVNCAVGSTGFCLNLHGEGVLLKAVQRSAGNTTPNLTTYLNEAGRWLALNLLHIVISFNLYPPLLPSFHVLSTGMFPIQINRGEHGYKGDNQ